MPTTRTWRGEVERKGYLLPRQEKTTILELVTSTGPTQRGIPFTAQRIGSLTSEFKKEHIFFMNTCSCNQEHGTAYQRFSLQKSLL